MLFRSDGLQQCDELGGLVRALSGGYLPVGMGGDLFRSPDILPTGRNLVQFDPRRAPTDAALERGAAIAEATLEHYRQTHGRYPRQTAVILWGLETAKTQGETIGQILAYLGVQLRRRGVWETRLEIIPLAELKRPPRGCSHSDVRLFPRHVPYPDRSAPGGNFTGCCAR